MSEKYKLIEFNAPMFYSNTPIERLEEKLKRFRYKPGYEIRLRRRTGTPASYLPGVEMFQLSVGLCVPDVNDPGGERTFVWCSEMIALHVLEDDRMLAQQLKNQFISLELHEVDEWLKLDGYCVTEPHPELAFNKITPDDIRDSRDLTP